MIRFIIKRRSYDGHIDMRDEALYTVDCDVPELEAKLRNGGHGPYGFTINELMGAELLDAAPEESC